MFERIVVGYAGDEAGRDAVKLALAELYGTRRRARRGERRRRLSALASGGDE